MATVFNGHHKFANDYYYLSNDHLRQFNDDLYSDDSKFQISVGKLGADRYLWKIYKKLLGIFGDYYYINYFCSKIQRCK